MDAGELKQLLEDATRKSRLLDHPFYQAWAEGTLSLEDLSFYSDEYRHQVEAFPGYLESLAARLPEGHARKIVLDNLRDEVEGDHLGLWLEFSRGVGAGCSEARLVDALDETQQCVAAFNGAAAQESPAFALGMLYAYESQTPEVAATKVKGLREHYGLDGRPLEYFELHAHLDVEHSDELVRALTSQDPSIEDAAAGAKAGAEAVWGLLSGISRALGVENRARA